MNLAKAYSTLTAVGNFLVYSVLSGNSWEGHLLSGQNVWNTDTATPSYHCSVKHLKTHLQRQEHFQPVLPAASESWGCTQCQLHEHRDPSPAHNVFISS